MSQKQKQPLKKYLALSFFAILVGFFLLLTPAVQSFLGKTLTKRFLEESGADLSVDRIYINPFGKAAFQDVLVRDHRQDTLIYAKEVRFNALRLRSFLEGAPKLGAVKMNGLRLNIQKHEGDTLSNLSIFGSKLKKDNSRKTPIHARTILIERAVLDITDHNQPQRPPMKFDNLHMSLDGFSLVGDSLDVDIEKLSFKEHSLSLRVSELNTNFSYTPTQMRLESFKMTTSQSQLNADISLEYPEKGMRNFAELVQIRSAFLPSTIGVDDIKSFMPDLGVGTINLDNGYLSGTLSDFKIGDLEITYSDSSFSGELQLQKRSEAGSDLVVDIGRFTANFSQLGSLFPRIKQSPLVSLERLDPQSITGIVQHKGSSSQIKLNIGGSSGLATLNLQLQSVENDWRYTGFVSVNEFELGKLLNQEKLGKTTFSLNVEGQGLEFQKLNSKAKGVFQSFGFNNYDYQNIDVNGVFDGGLFTGDLKIDDPNLAMAFSGSFDTLEEKKNISCLAKVSRANLSTIGVSFLRPGTVFSGDIELVSQGVTADDFIGDLFVDSGKLSYQDETFVFSNFTAQSRLNNGVRFLNLQSQDILNGLLYGNFNLSQIPSLVKNALGGYFSNYQSEVIQNGQFLNFNFNLRGKIASALVPGLELNDNTFVRGSLDGDQNLLRLKLNAPKLKWHQSEIDRLSLQLDNKNPLVNAHLKFDQFSSEKIQTGEFNLVNTAINDTLFFRAEYENAKLEGSDGNLNFYFTFDKNKQPVVGVQPSSIGYRDQSWDVNASNHSRLFFNNLGYRLEPTILTNASSQLTIGIEKNTYQNISAVLKNINLSDFLPPSPGLQVDGLANGSLSVKNNSEGIGGDSKISIDNFTLNDVFLGKATLELFNTKDQEYSFSFATDSDNLSTSNINGSVFYNSLNNTLLDLQADFTNFPMAPLKNLMGSSFENVSGVLNGQLSIDGKLTNPMLKGNLLLSQFSFDVPYLGVSYDFPQNIEIDVLPDVLEFNSAPFTDLNHSSQGIVRGRLSHSRFKNFTPDFTISSDRMLVLDTKFNPQSNYYGTAFMNGSVHIYGSTQNINFDIDGQTVSGTNISIPILEATSLDDATYIRFVDKKPIDSTPDLSTKEIKGLSLNFDLDVTPDAQLEIVVDTDTGSTLQGSGVGNILMEINSNGVFNIWGDYIALEGQYNFKNLGIIEKNFSVRPGGTISWNGDPNAAQINMEAVYDVPGGANPTVLIETTGVNRKIPTEVTVNLNGNLLNLETPTFNIDFPNASPNLRNDLDYRLIDEERRQLQAISLLSQGVFISQFSLSALSTQTLTNNLFQKASGVFESIFSGNEDKMNVGLDYLQGDRNAAATIQTRDRLGLTLVTQISDRMLINGKVGVPVGGVEETIIVGDVTIEFLLNDDGSLRARIFNRENEFQYFGDDLGYTQGIGISYKVEFDDFKSLIKKIIKKNNIL